MVELARRLRAERSVRKACEKWLRSELRSRVSAGRGSLKGCDVGMCGCGWVFREVWEVG